MADLSALRRIAAGLCRRLAHRASYPGHLGAYIALLGVVLTGRLVGAVYLSAAFAGYGHHAVAQAGAAAQLVVVAVFLPAIVAAGGHRMRAAVAEAQLVAAAPLGSRFLRFVAVRSTVRRPFTVLITGVLAGISAPLIPLDPAGAAGFFALAVAAAGLVLASVSLLVARLGIPSAAAVYLEMVYLAAAVALYPSLGRGADGPAALAFGRAWDRASLQAVLAAVGVCVGVVVVAAALACLSSRARRRLRSEPFPGARRSPVLAYYLRTAPLSAWAFVYVTAGASAFVPPERGAYVPLLAGGAVVVVLTFAVFLARYEGLVRDRWHIAPFSAARGRLVLPALFAHVSIAAVPYAAHLIVRLL